MNKRKDYNIILENMNQNFNIEKFNKLDKELSKVIYDGRYKELLYDSLESELEAKLSEIIDKKMKRKILKNNDTNVIKEFIILCERNDKEFYLTRTFKAYIQMSMLNDYSEGIDFDLLNYIKKYLDYANKKYLMVNARTAYFIINATRVKRYKDYRKVKNILKQFKEEYNLTKYEEIIKNRTTLNKIEFFDFICEVNKMKIVTGIIPLEVCEYLICEMLNPDSIISTDYEFWADLRECVFCDFASHIQISRYKVYDYLNYVKKIEEYRGNYRCNNKTICIDENIIYRFRDFNARAFITTMHELVHFEQYLAINKRDYGRFNYEIVKEDIIIDNIKNFKKKNYWYLSKEIEARKKAIEDAIEYLVALKFDINNLRVLNGSIEKGKYISLLEYKQIVLEDYEWCLLEKEYLYPKLNFNKKISNIVKREPKLILDKPILKYEYNEDGTIKNINDIIESLEEALKNKELSKDSIKGIFKYSILNTFNIKRFESVVKKIVKHQYINEKNRKMFLEILMNIIIEKQSRTKLIKDLDKRQEFESILTKQLDYIDKYK